MNRVMTGLDKKRGDALGEVLVDQPSHAEGLSGRVRWSTAAAAKRSASRTSPMLSWGKSTLMPSATMPTIVATGMRVPRMQGTRPSHGDRC